MEIYKNLNIIGSNEYIDTEGFCIYAAKNPFWSNCQTNEIIAPVKGKNAIAVNLVDADDPKYFKVGIFKQLVRLISDKINSGDEVTIVCNMGKSRSASIGLLYLSAIGEISKESYKKAKQDFIKVYPTYSPGRGISLFLDNTWSIFFPNRKRNL